MEVLNKIRGGLIVSCQALPDEPLHSPEIMGRMAKAAVSGGAVAIRANSVADIKEIKEQVDVPIIGIIKKIYNDSDVYITPTIDEVDQLMETNVDVIALDATNRIRPNNIKLEQLICEIKTKYPNQLLMADCATIFDVQIAISLGFDIISSTLVGYTQDSIRNKIEDNNFLILQQMIRVSHDNKRYFIAEGNINTPDKMQYALELGADSVVVGSMITRPQLITRSFTSKLTKEINFIDMDGVLVDADANINQNAIHKMMNSVAIPVINTGRLMHDIDYVIDKYNLKSNFKIAANGAHIQNRSGEDIVVHEFDEKTRDEIYRELRKPAFNNVRIEVNTKTNRYFFSKRPKDFPKEFKDSAIITNIDQEIKHINVIGFLLIFNDYNQISEEINKLKQKYSGIIQFEKSSESSLEIYLSTASKGNAIKYLKEHKYIDETVFTRAYGDSYNDISMFNEVDESYAISGDLQVESKAMYVINHLHEGL